MPVFSKLTADLSSMMGTMTENLKEPLYAVRETAVKSGEPMFERMGQTIGKIMGGHFGKTFRLEKLWEDISVRHLRWTNNLKNYGRTFR